jgi:tetratricopeptide (TPR) repeat protein
MIRPMARIWLPLGLLLACAPALNSLQLAEQAMEAGDLDTAEVHLEEAMQDPSLDGRATLAMIDLHMARGAEFFEGAPHRALTHYEKVLELDPQNGDARAAAGRAMVASHRGQEAVYLLEADPACAPCQPALGAALVDRARDWIAAGENAKAMVDLGRAAELAPSLELHLMVAELSTANPEGDPGVAVAAIEAAYSALDGASTQDAQRWWDLRTAAAVMAGRAAKGALINRAFAFPDPRKGVNVGRQRDDRWDLMLAVAEAEQAGGRVAEGVKRAKAVLDEAEGVFPPTSEKLIVFRRRVMERYVELAAVQLLYEAGAEAHTTLERALRRDPENVQLAYLDVLARSSSSSEDAQAALDEIPAAAQHHDRVQAIVHVAAAREHVRKKEFEAARERLELARAFPDLLELHLIEAELLMNTEMPGVTKTELADFKRIGAYKLPRGRANHYAQALSEIIWAHARFEEPNEQRERMRMPGFARELKQVEDELREIIPFEVRRIPGDEPRVIVKNPGSEALTLKVIGPGVNESVPVEPGKSHTAVFERPGLAIVRTGQRARAVFCDARTAIVLAE